MVILSLGEILNSKMDASKINWYPGHMKRAIDKIDSKIDDIDFVIEVLDARGIRLTNNDQLLSRFKNKRIIKVALKSDLSDVTISDDEIIFCSINNKDIKNIIVNKLNVIFDDKIKSLKKKGLVNPIFIGMVIGIPNVGKSSLINSLSAKKTLKVENRSGVTRKQETRRINDNFYLVDTPGIFFKNIDNFIDGCKLVVLNNIKQDVVPIEQVLDKIYSYFMNNYKDQLIKFYDLDKIYDFSDFVNFIAKKYNFILANNKIDYNRTYQFILNNFSNSCVCKFHFD